MIDLTAEPDEPKAIASERIAVACRELHRLHLLTGWFDRRGYWFPNDPARIETTSRHYSRSTKA